MNVLVLRFFLLLFFLPAWSLYAQQIWRDTTLTVQESFGEFSGSGFVPGSVSGPLNSQYWSIEGLSDGTIAFGDSVITGDAARGTTAGGVSAGGVYAFQAGDDAGLLLQPTGSDLTPGVLKTLVVNDLPITVRSVYVSQTWSAINNNNRSTSVHMSVLTHDSVLIADIQIGATESTATSAGAQLLYDSTTHVEVEIAPGDTLFVDWTLDDNGGSGGRDELILNEFVCTAVVQPPVVVCPDSLVVFEDIYSVLQCLVVDTDSDSSEIEVVSVECDLGEISVARSADSLSLLYSPYADTNGADTIVLALSDGYHISETIVPVTIVAVNDAPEIHATDSNQYLRHDTVSIPVEINDDTPFDELHIGVEIEGVSVSFETNESYSFLQFESQCSNSTIQTVRIVVSDADWTTTAYVTLVEFHEPAPTIRSFTCYGSAQIHWPLVARAANFTVVGGTGQFDSLGFAEVIATAADPVTLALLAEFTDGCVDTSTVMWTPKGMSLFDDVHVLQAQQTEAVIDLLTNDIIFSSIDSVSLIGTSESFELRNNMLYYSDDPNPQTTAQCEYVVYAGECSSTATVFLSRQDADTISRVTTHAVQRSKYVLCVAEVEMGLVVVNRHGISFLNSSNSCETKRLVEYAFELENEVLDATIWQEHVVAVHPDRIAVYKVKTGETNTSLQVLPITELVFPDVQFKAEQCFFSDNGAQICLVSTNTEQLHMFRLYEAFGMVGLVDNGLVALPNKDQTDHYIVHISDRGDQLFIASYLGHYVNHYKKAGCESWNAHQVYHLEHNGCRALKYNPHSHKLAVLNWRQKEVSVLSLSSTLSPPLVQSLPLSCAVRCMQWVGMNTLIVGSPDTTDERWYALSGTQVVHIPVPKFTRSIRAEVVGEKSQVHAFGYQTVKTFQLSFGAHPP